MDCDVSSNWSAQQSGSLEDVMRVKIPFLHQLLHFPSFFSYSPNAKVSLQVLFHNQDLGRPILVFAAAFGLPSAPPVPERG